MVESMTTRKIRHKKVNEEENKTNTDINKHPFAGSGVVITSPRTVMSEASFKNGYDTMSGENKDHNGDQRQEGDAKSTSTSTSTTTGTNTSTSTNASKSSRTDWSKFTVTVPKSLEEMWSERNRGNSDSAQEGPVVFVKSNSIDSDDEGPVLGLPPDMSSSNHS